MAARYPTDFLARHGEGTGIASYPGVAAVNASGSPAATLCGETERSRVGCQSPVPFGPSRPLSSGREAQRHCRLGTGYSAPKHPTSRAGRWPSKGAIRG